MKTRLRVRSPGLLASSPKVEGVTGQYSAHRKPKASRQGASYDTAAAARLWQASAALTGLTASA